MNLIEPLLGAGRSRQRDLGKRRGTDGVPAVADTDRYQTRERRAVLNSVTLGRFRSSAPSTRSW